MAIILGGNGADTRVGGAQSDIISGGNGNDVLSGGGGGDIILGGNGADIVSGDAGNDILSGDNGDDVIEGGEGNDLLSGGNGADMLDGGAGSDVVFGDAGNDTAVYRAAENQDSLDFYDGGKGQDTLRLVVSSVQFASSAFQLELLTYQNLLSNNLTADQLFVFESLNLAVRDWEQIEVVVENTNENQAPTDIGLSSLTIAENALGAVVGTIGVVDPDAGDSHAFTLSDSRFEVVGGQLKLKAGQSLDFETAATVALTVTATDAGGLTFSEDFTLQVGDANEAPTDIGLSSLTVAENAAGPVVGTLSATDPDAGDSHAFTLSDSRFEVVGGQLKLKAGQSLDLETEATVALTVTAMDAGGLTFSEDFTIAVTNVNEGPTDITLVQAAIAENALGAVVGTIGVVDPDAGDSHTFTLSDARFEVVGEQLKLRDDVSLNFEEHGDVEVTVTATDAGGLPFEKTFTIQVTNVVEATGGQAIDGYIAGATVFGDANDNGQLDAGEASSVTDSQGNYALVDAVGPLVLIGGTDISTGQAFTGVLKAAEGSTTITPLTSLVVALTESGLLSAAEAEQAVKDAFGLGGLTSSLSDFDPIEAALSSDPEISALGAAGVAAGVTVQSTLTAATALLVGAGAASQEQAYAAVLMGLANEVSDGIADLTSSVSVLAILTQAQAELETGLSLTTLEDATTAISSVNTAIETAAQSGAPATELLTAITQVQIVAQGDLADALADAGATNDASGVENDFSGENLDTAIEEAASEVGDVDGGDIGTEGDDTMTGGAGSDVIEGRDGNDTIEGLGGADQLFGEGGDDTLDGGEGDDTLDGGTGDDFLVGGEGADAYDGGDGDFDQVNFQNESGGQGAVVDLAAGTGTDTYGNAETFSGIEVLRGSQRADSFTGDASDNTFRGLAGADILDGGDGSDTVRYDRDANSGGFSGVTVDLAGGNAIDGFGDADTLISIENARGSESDDTLLGNDEANDLRGLGGNDYLEGGAGGDFLEGGDGDDELVSGGATVGYDAVNDTYAFIEVDHLEGGAGNDTLTATGGNVVLVGGAGDDTIISTGNNGYFDSTRVSYRASTTGITVTVNAPEGQTVQDGLGGTDTVTGVAILFDSAHDDSVTLDTYHALEVRLSAGDDTVNFDGYAGHLGYVGAGGGVLVDLQLGTATDVNAIDDFIGSDTIIGQVEMLRGSDFADQLYGSAGDDLLRGEAGDDLIDGRGGGDAIQFFGSSTGVHVDLSQGTVFDDGLGGQDTLISIEAVDGSDFDDLIIGDSGDNGRLSGNHGDDEIHGGDGNDTLIGDYGIDPVLAAAGWTSNDQLFGDGGDDTLRGGDGDDALDGGEGNDSLEGEAGDDTLGGGVGDDYLLGGDGDDALDGGEGNDTLRSGDGDDTLFGGDGHDVVEGEDGNDQIEGGDGDDFLDGGAGQDQLHGGAGNDELISGGSTAVFDAGANTWIYQRDRLDGGDGDDTLIATAGDTLMIGGAGDDNLIADNDGGYFDFALASYRTSDGGIVAEADGSGGLTIQDGLGGVDSVSGVNVLFDSVNDDSITLDSSYQSTSGGILEVRLSSGNDTVTFDDFAGRVGYRGAGGGVLADLLLGTATDLDANDNFIGNDTFIGQVGTLRGSDFGDELYGSNDDDRLRGEGGDDLIDGRDGFDRIQFGGSDTGIHVDLSQNAVLDDGLGGQDMVFNIEGVDGSDSGDLIIGDSGDNWLNGNLGDDEIHGGAGDDHLVGDFGIDPQAAAAGAVSNDALYGGDGDDLIEGGDGDDYLDGGAGGDELYGGAGDDTLVGGGAISPYDADNDTYLFFEQDRLVGGDGDDTLTATGGDVLMIGGAGNDTMTAVGGGFFDFTRVNYRDSDAGIVATTNGAVLSIEDGLGGIDTVEGVQVLMDSVHGDTITIDASYQTISGNPIELRLSSGDDTATFVGVAGRVAYRGAQGGVYADLDAGTATDLNPGDGFIGNDTFVGEIGFFRGSDFADEIHGSAADEQLSGEGGDDLIDGGGGIDRIRFGGSDFGVHVDLSQNMVFYDGIDGQDSVFNIEDVDGSDFGDLIVGDSGDNRLNGNLGDDEIHGGEGNDHLIGDFGIDPEAAASGWTSNDQLHGGDGDDTLEGGDGSDYLGGGAGHDTLIGGAGDDYMEGGEGIDTYIGGDDPDSYDAVSFAGENGTAGVFVDLAAGTATDSFGNAETLTGIEEATGTALDDVLIGNDADNYFVGLAGIDSYAGGAGGFDQVDFSNETGGFGVTVNLVTGTGTDTYGNVETFSGIEVLRGSQWADTFTGDASDNTFRGLAGADILDGGDGSDTVRYDRDVNSGGANGVTVDLANGSAIDGFGDTDTLTGIENARGSRFADVLIGDAQANQLQGLGGDDFFVGGDGADTFIGGDDEDTFDHVSFDDAGGTQGVTVNLAAGTATDSFNNAETLIGIEDVTGTSFADTLTGSDGDDWFQGLAGADAYDGADGGFDQVNFHNETGAFGVTVNLVAGTGTDTYGNAETFSGIENVRGSLNADNFTGGAENNTFRGLAGNDILDGGDGVDTVRYDRDVNSGGLNGVTVDLAGGFATDGFGHTDTLTGIENARGTQFADTLLGTDQNNDLRGLGGDDLLEGGEGDDWLDGGADSDELYGGLGNDMLVSGGTFTDYDAVNDTFLYIQLDRLDGGEGDDTLIATDGDVVMVGGVGDDTLIADNAGGYFDFARVSYRTSTSGIVVDSDGAGGLTVQDGLDGTDSVSGVNVLLDSAHDDTITLDGSYESTNGGPIEVRLSAGDDLVTFTNGYAGRVGYRSVGGGVYADLNAGYATDLNPGDNLIGYDTFIGQVGTLRGSDFADELYGSDGDERLQSDRGNDFVDGRGGIDRITFGGSEFGVHVDLSQNIVFDDGLGGQDTLANIENVQGSEFGDLIVGDSGDNWLNGNLGDDEIHGGDGADNLIGDFVIDPETAALGVTSNDALFGGDGNDQLYGGDGVDELYGEGDADFLDGGESDDHLDGGAGDDQLEGRSGDDFLVGGEGADNYDGGEGGFDQVSFADETGGQGAVLNLALQTGTDTYGNAETVREVEVVRGSQWSDEFIGDDLDNTFRGLAGDDDLNGGGGIDTVRYDRDVNYGGMNGVYVHLGDQAATDGFGNFDQLISIENAHGSGFDDSLHGSDEDNNLRGLGGDDYLEGGDGDDTLEGGDGSDYLGGGAGHDTLIGGAGDDYMEGGEGIDTYIGGDDPDSYDAVSFAGENGTAGVFVDLAAGTATDSFGNAETLTGIEEATGTALDDVLIGNDADNYFVGLAGIDSYAGGAGGFDQVDFSNETGGFGVTVNLVTGTGTDTYGNVETFSGIEVLRGSQWADTFTGDASDNTFRGLAGADILDGGDGSDTVRYDRDVNSGGANGVTVDLANGSAIDGFGDTDTLTGIENARGSRFADVLIGDAQANQLQGLGGDDFFVGGDGADTFIGGDDEDTFDHVSFDDAGGTQGVTVNLAAGTATDSFNNAETLIGIEDVTGTSFADTLTGSDGDDWFQGLAGADAYDGADGGFDQVNFHNETGAFGVTVNLVAGTGTDTYGNAETFSGIENVRGSLNADNFTGGAENNTFRGLAGNDILDGGDGVDTVRYDRDVNSGGLNGVTVDLAGGFATDGFGHTDTLTGIENARGTQFADTLLGTDQNNDLRGLGGDDLLEGGEGDDWLDGGFGADTFVLKPGGGQDTVADFNLLDGDVIQLTGYSIASWEDFDSFDFDGTDTLVGLGGTDTLTVKGIDLTSLANPNDPFAFA